MTFFTLFSQIKTIFQEILTQIYFGGEFTDLLIGFPALLYTSLLQRVIIIKQIQQ